MSEWVYLQGDPSEQLTQYRNVGLRREIGLLEERVHDITCYVEPMRPRPSMPTVLPRCGQAVMRQ